MPKSVIPKAENTSEVIEASLLKNTFISKRNALHRNTIPLKYRNNLKLSIAQLDNERTGLVQNLNVVLQKSKLNQDEQNKKDISFLYNYKTQEYNKLNNLRKYYTDLDKEISWWQIKNSKKQKDIIKARLKVTKDQYIYGNVEEILIKKANWYNNRIMKQQKLRHSLDCLLKEMTFKTKIYDSIMCQLEKEGQNLIGVGEEALKSYQEREKALRDLETFRDINKAEEKQREDKMYLTTYKLKLDQGLNEFLQKKCRTRYNEHTDIKNEKEDLEKKLKSKELELFIKYLINIGGNTDLSTIVQMIKNMSYNKESLFRILILFEQQIMEFENSICATESIAIKRKETNSKINEYNECRKKMYIDTIEKNETTLKKKKLFTDNLINLYKEFHENINNILQALKISQSSMEQSGISGITFEENMMDYFKEIEKKSIEKLIIVNCIENSCTTGLNEDPLSSDAESTENLITKDYLNGVQIKMHKFLNMEDSSTIPISIHKLDNGFEPSPCPHCMEARFIEDGYCSILSSSKINFLKENPQEMSGVCCTELMKHLDFKNTSQKIAPLLHSKSNCKKTPNLKVMKKNE